MVAAPVQPLLEAADCGGRPPTSAQLVSAILGARKGDFALALDNSRSHHVSKISLPCTLMASPVNLPKISKS